MSGEDTQEVLARLRAVVAGVPADPGPHANPEGAGTDGAAGEAAAPADPAVAAALTHLVRSTSRRPLTVAEARDKLAGRDHPPEVVDEAVGRAVRQRILDDAGFARAWVEDRGVKRGYGRARLGRELRRRGVPDDVVDQALARLDDTDEVGQAMTLARARAQRMPATLEPVKVANRLVGFLVRRGYPSHVATSVARKVTAMDRDWD